jgi:ABC-type dipeptide/oligopeptide/nickel transport system permease subunit
MSLTLLTVGAMLGWLVVGESSVRSRTSSGLKNAPPSLQHLFGTDQFSRDVFARVLTGGASHSPSALSPCCSPPSSARRTDWSPAIAGGRDDTLMMRLLDGLMSIPRVLLLIAVLTLWRPGLPG